MEINWFYACLLGDLQKAKRLLAGNPRLLNSSAFFEGGEGNFNGKSGLLVALSYGSVDLVNWLLDQPGLNLNCADVRGWNGLHYACAYGSPLTILKRLVDIGVDVNKKTAAGHTPVDLWTVYEEGAIYLAYRGGNASRSTKAGILNLGQLLRGGRVAWSGSWPGKRSCSAALWRRRNCWNWPMR